MSVTRFGVSLLNVVATIERPASHHGTARPETKNSEVFRPARRPMNNAGAKQMTRMTATMIQSQLKKLGIAVDVVELDPPSLFARWRSGDYDSIYFGLQASALDPAMNLDFWLSSGSGHFWNASQKTPTTEWERRIDTLMLEQAATLDPERRRQQFMLVQRIMAENLPVLYFAAPRIYFAHTPKVGGVIPSVTQPPVLWNADSLFVQ